MCRCRDPASLSHCRYVEGQNSGTERCHAKTVNPELLPEEVSFDVGDDRADEVTQHSYRDRRCD